MNNKKTKLWIIGGFLGSGKTTLLNRLLQQMPGQRLGVVVNDFGTLGVDAGLIESSGEGDIVELKGGQIFCSCISGNFVKSIVGLADRQLDGILVESSGLAKPSALWDIMDEALKQTKGIISYNGLVNIIDAERITTLIKVVNAVEEQIYYADLIVINKIDLVSDDDLKEIRQIVNEINPQCQILETTNGDIHPQHLPDASLSKEPASAPEHVIQGPFSDTVKSNETTPQRFKGWGSKGRPKASIWKPQHQLTENELKRAVKQMSDTAFRIKGYITTKEGTRFVSASGNQIDILPSQTSPKEEGLTVIVPGTVSFTKLFKELIH